MKHGGYGLNIIFIGDIVGGAARRLLKEKLPGLKKQYDTTVCIANVENAAAGLGLTPTLAREFRHIGVDVMTLGNHTWSKRELLQTIDDIPNLIRPANVPAAWPGKGHILLNLPEGPFLLINLLGRIFMDPVDDPFACADRIIGQVRQNSDVRMVMVDFHAEATSEKTAMAHHLNGRVSLVVGTHTHVQTADERILDRGTGYLTDVGMTGPVEGIIGMDAESSLRRMVDRLPAAYHVAHGPSAIAALVADIDPLTGQTRRIERLQIHETT